MAYVLTLNNMRCKIYAEGTEMNKSTTISIRIDEEELKKIKLAAKLSSYSSYSEFIRRTVLLESAKIISQSLRNNDLKGERM